jgi:hypothetical protein
VLLLPAVLFLVAKLLLLCEDDDHHFANLFDEGANAVEFLTTITLVASR